MNVAPGPFPRAAPSDASHLRAGAIENARFPAFPLGRWVATARPQQPTSGIQHALPGHCVPELLRLVVDLTLAVADIVRATLYGSGR